MEKDFDCEYFLFFFLKGICSYLEEQFGERVKNMGVVIGYDHRRLSSLCSEQFARISAAVFCSHGIRTILFDRFVATPFVVS